MIRRSGWLTAAFIVGLLGVARATVLSTPPLLGHDFSCQAVNFTSAPLEVTIQIYDDLGNLIRITDSILPPQASSAARGGSQTSFSILASCQIRFTGLENTVLGSLCVLDSVPQCIAAVGAQ